MAKEKKLPQGEKQAGETEPVLLDEVAGIIRLMGETGLAELDLETAGMKVSLRRHSACAHAGALPNGNGVQNVIPTYMPPPAPPSAAPSAPPRPAPAKSPAETAPVEANRHKIVSPMAGTFYRAPAPSSPSFVNSGDVVKAGQPVCIVEAMKLMNEIKADKAGKIVNILVENGKPVEKGTVLFHIDTGA